MKTEKVFVLMFFFFFLWYWVSNLTPDRKVLYHQPPNPTHVRPFKVTIKSSVSLLHPYESESKRSNPWLQREVCVERIQYTAVRKILTSRFTKDITEPKWECRTLCQGPPAQANFKLQRQRQWKHSSESGSARTEAGRSPGLVAPLTCYTLVTEEWSWEKSPTLLFQRREKFTVLHHQIPSFPLTKQLMVQLEHWQELTWTQNQWIQIYSGIDWGTLVEESQGSGKRLCKQGHSLPRALESVANAFIPWATAAAPSN